MSRYDVMVHLLNAWEHFPDARLCQILDSAIHGRDLQTISDEALVDAVETFTIVSAGTLS